MAGLTTAEMNALAQDSGVADGGFNTKNEKQSVPISEKPGNILC